jgi:tRNA(Ile)-lysidine synthase
LREDCSALDDLAQTELDEALADTGLDARRLRELPDALRRRVIRGWLLAGGAIDLTDEQIRRVDDLVVDWHGQGGVAVGSSLRRERLVAARAGGALRLNREPM